MIAEKPRTWLFLDFDNTIMDTEKHTLPSLIARFNALYGHQIPDPLTVDIFQDNFKGQAREVLCANLGRYFGIAVDCPTLYDQRDWRMMEHMQRIAGGIAIAPHLLDILALLQQQDIRFAFVSNNSIQRAMSAMRFAACGRGEELARYFACYWFEAGAIQKPKPDVYLRAMDQLSVSTDHCFSVEDSVTGVTAAVTAGITTFAYTGLTDDPDHAAQRMMAAGAATAFHDWRDFPPLFERLRAETTTP